MQIERQISDHRAFSMLRFLLALTWALPLADCDRAEQDLRWKEDVKMPEGHIITISRRTECKAVHELGQGLGESTL